jgi:hypothetical protein
MWHCRGSLPAIQADTMVLVRGVMPVRGVVHGQTANPARAAVVDLAARAPGPGSTLRGDTAPEDSAPG